MKFGVPGIEAVFEVIQVVEQLLTEPDVCQRGTKAGTTLRGNEGRKALLMLLA